MKNYLLKRRKELKSYGSYLCLDIFQKECKELRRIERIIEERYLKIISLESKTFKTSTSYRGQNKFVRLLRSLDNRYYDPYTYEEYTLSKGIATKI